MSSHRRSRNRGKRGHYRHLPLHRGNRNPACFLDTHLLELCCCNIPLKRIWVTLLRRTTGERLALIRVIVLACRACKVGTGSTQKMLRRGFLGCLVHQGRWRSWLCFKSKRTVVSESILIRNSPPLDLRTAHQLRTPPDSLKIRIFTKWCFFVWRLPCTNSCCHFPMQMAQSFSPRISMALSPSVWSRLMVFAMSLIALLSGSKLGLIVWAVATTPSLRLTISTADKMADAEWMTRHLNTSFSLKARTACVEDSQGRKGSAKSLGESIKRGKLNTSEGWLQAVKFFFRLHHEVVLNDNRGTNLNCHLCHVLSFIERNFD